MHDLHGASHPLGRHPRNTGPIPSDPPLGVTPPRPHPAPTAPPHPPPPSGHPLAAPIPCGHAFHRVCLSAWTAHSPTCPLCKRPVDWLTYGGAIEPAFHPWGTLHSLWLELAGLRLPLYGTTTLGPQRPDPGTYTRPPGRVERDTVVERPPSWPAPWADILWNLRCRAFHLGIPPRWAARLGLFLAPNPACPLAWLAWPETDAPCPPLPVSIHDPWGGGHETWRPGSTRTSTTARGCGAWRTWPRGRIWTRSRNDSSQNFPSICSAPPFTPRSPAC